MSGFVDIGALDDIPPQGARLIRTSQGCIAVFRTADDRLFALDDRCPHKGGRLSEGIVHGASVTCPLHNRVFDLNTGLAAGMDEGSVQTYGIRLEAGRILIDSLLLARRAAA